MGDASKFTFIVVERRCFPSDVYLLHEIEKEKRKVRCFRKADTDLK